MMGQGIQGFGILEAIDCSENMGYLCQIECPKVSVCSGLEEPPTTPQQGNAILTFPGKSIGPCLGRGTDIVYQTSCEDVSVGRVIDGVYDSTTGKYSFITSFIIKLTNVRASLDLNVIFSHDVDAADVTSSDFSVSQGANSYTISLSHLTAHVMSPGDIFEATIEGKYVFDGINDVCVYDIECASSDNSQVLPSTEDGTFNITYESLAVRGTVEYHCGNASVFDEAGEPDTITLECGVNGWNRPTNSIPSCKWSHCPRST